MLFDGYIDLPFSFGLQCTVGRALKAVLHHHREYLYLTLTSSWTQDGMEQLWLRLKERTNVLLTCKIVVDLEHFLPVQWPSLI